jgi:hypothetical protein
MACYSFRIDPGHCIVFFAQGQDEAPPESVEREVRVLANLSRDAPVRGIGTELATMAISGVVGGGAWAAAASALVATRRYLARLGSKRKRLESPDDVIARLREAWIHLHGKTSEPLASVGVSRENDGTWSATFVYGRRTVTARLDATGSVADIVQRPDARTADNDSEDDDGGSG